MINKNVELNGKCLQWNGKVKHLGNHLTNDCDDRRDIEVKRGVFITSVNDLLCNFRHVDCHVLSNLFSNYCCSF